MSVEIEFLFYLVREPIVKEALAGSISIAKQHIDANKPHMLRQRLIEAEDDKLASLTHRWDNKLPRSIQRQKVIQAGLLSR